MRVAVETVAVVCLLPTGWISGATGWLALFCQPYVQPAPPRCSHDLLRRLAKQHILRGAAFVMRTGVYGGGRGLPFAYLLLTREGVRLSRSHRRGKGGNVAHDCGVAVFRAGLGVPFVHCDGHASSMTLESATTFFSGIAPQSWRLEGNRGSGEFVRSPRTWLFMNLIPSIHARLWTP